MTGYLDVTTIYPEVCKSKSGESASYSYYHTHPTKPPLNK